ncbi:hypothetical protein [Clostridium sp. KNHs214]|uniref:hypothetical protein n=1 Tax=Clostridium sp. KNHs214 TaxID=1540257 RepID=UPI0005555157|nr:hypothetical protein [Clostridium sp. KNHs214]
MGKITIDLKDNIFNNSNDFPKEKDLQNYLDINMKSFVSDILNLDYKNHERESFIINKRFGGNKPRIDFLINLKNNECVLIECKNPKNKHREIISALGQILDYILLAEKAGKKIKDTYLVTSKINQTALDIIDRFKLPIKVCLINKENLMICNN